MKKIKIISLCVLSAIVVSCGSSNDVVSGRLITKRKVNKGFHINSSNNLKTQGEDANMAKRAEFIQYSEAEVVVSQTNESVVDVVSNESVKANTIQTNDVVTIENVANNSTENVVVNNKNTKTLNSKNKISKEDKKIVKNAFKAIKQDSKKASDDMLVLLYVLCVLVPFVAVGIVTDWDIKTVVINLLWSLLCVIPGIIHAFIVVGRES